MENSRKNLLKYGYIALATFVATKLVGGICWLFSIMLVLSLILAGRVFFEVLDKKDITIKRIVLSMIIVLIFMGVGIYHRVYCHNAKNVEMPEAVVECEDETDCTPVQDVVVPQGQTDSSKKAPRKTAPSPKDIKDDSVLKEKGVDYTEAKTTTGTTTNEVSLEDDTLKEEKKITEEAIEKAKEEGKDITEHDSGIITIVDNKDKEEDKKEDKKEPVITEEEIENAEKIESEESKKDQKPAEDLEVKEDKYVAADDDQLDELEKLTAKEDTEKTANSIVEAKKEVETKPEETKTEEVETVTEKVETVVEEVETVVEEVEIQNDQTVETVEAVEVTEEVNEIVEPVVETVEPKVEVIEAQEVKDAEIKVTAIDGYEGFINSDIQFKVTGDNVVVEGLDGTNSNYNPATGMLTVNSSEATVVTVQLTNATSEITFDVTINGIVK